jgi:DNA-binding response OmpR family regulator
MTPSRVAGVPIIPEVSADANVRGLGNISLNLGNYGASVNGQSIDLTFKEWELLLLLLSRPDQVITYAELTEALWGRQEHVRTKTLNVLVYRLRAKLKGAEPYQISTVRGRGYGLIKPFAIQQAPPES